MRQILSVKSDCYQKPFDVKNLFFRTEFLKVSLEWLDEMNRQDYQKTDQLVIGTPIEQKFVNAGSGNRSNGGVFEAQNLKKSSLSVAEFRELTMSERYKE